jgi:hypothetical protein
MRRVDASVSQGIWEKRCGDCAGESVFVKESVLAATAFNRQRGLSQLNFLASKVKTSSSRSFKTICE